MSHVFDVCARFGALCCVASVAVAQSNFVNWETPHVHPLDVTPDGTRLVAVNTPDNRIEVFDLRGAGVVRAFDVPVGLDPVSVRARSNGEVWVVNHISDSISVVDLASRSVCLLYTSKTCGRLRTWPRQRR